MRGCERAVTASASKSACGALSLASDVGAGDCLREDADELGAAVGSLWAGLSPRSIPMCRAAEPAPDPARAREALEPVQRGVRAAAAAIKARISGCARRSASRTLMCRATLPVPSSSPAVSSSMSSTPLLNMMLTQFF